MQKIILLPKIIHSRSVNSKKSRQNWLFLAVCRLSGSYDLLKIISFYYFLFLRFQANPPIPAPSEETASPNHPNTLAGSPVFTESLPLVLDLFVVPSVFFTDELFFFTSALIALFRLFVALSLLPDFLLHPVLSGLLSVRPAVLSSCLLCSLLL